MTDLVRVKLDDGSEVTVGREYATIYDLELIDKPAVDGRGTALDAKPMRTVDEAAEADPRTPAQKAAATRAAKKAAADEEARVQQEQADARAAAQAEADAANAAAQETSSPSGDADSTEETR